jgi:hypothetical protein
MTDPTPYWTSADAFAAAVEKATAQATQNVAATHRKRLMLSGGIVGAIVACAVAIPTTIGISNSTKHANCVLITQLAGVAQEESEEASTSAQEFEENSHDRLGLSQSKFELLVKKGQERRERHLIAIENVADHSC